MRFAHLADVHIGAWRDPKMKELPNAAFAAAVSDILERKVDFVLVCGDLFNTAVPPLDMVKRTVAQLQRFKAKSIPVYAIAGSHDYSPTGKTMLDVLEEAELLVNVMKGRVADGKLVLDPVEGPGVTLAGILGRANSLDREYYEDLDRAALEALPGPKVFLFHAALAELKPKSLAHVDAQPASLLPRGFDYYAGGHVHITEDASLPGYKQVVYPGPLYPASFSELEELGTGAYCLVDDWRLERVPVPVKERVTFVVDAQGKSAAAANAALAELADEDVADKVVLLRIAGELREGRASEVTAKELFAAWYERGAYHCMKNTAKLTSKEFDAISVPHATNEEVEARVVREHVGQHPINGLDADGEAALLTKLLAALGSEQGDDEKKGAYEERVTAEARALLRPKTI